MSTEYYTVEGTLWPMPFNVAGPLLYYDKAAFRKAGLDPEKPPTNLDEVRAAAQTLKDTGSVENAGFGFKLDPWLFEQWIAIGGKTYVNNSNGRKARATTAQFDDKVGQKVFTWLDGMVRDGLAETNAYEGPSSTDNLLGIGTHSHAMTIDSTSALGTISQVLGSGQYADIELGVAPMPAAVKGNGGVQVGGAALYIVNKSTPAEQEGAWRFAKFLNEPEQVATWSAATGYVPIVESAVDLPAVQQRWAELPGFKVAYDQLLTGPNNAATAGPVIGDYDGDARRGEAGLRAAHLGREVAEGGVEGHQAGDRRRHHRLQRAHRCLISGRAPPPGSDFASPALPSSSRSLPWFPSARPVRAAGRCVRCARSTRRTSPSRSRSGTATPARTRKCSSRSSTSSRRRTPTSG